MTNRDEEILKEVNENTKEVKVVEEMKEEIDFLMPTLDKTKPTIYLCGGFYGDWNDQVREYVGDQANVLDPRDFKSVNDEHVFVQADLDMIDESDIVFAYRQKENPSIGMCHEIGYAAAWNKYIIFHGEYESSKMERYFGFSRIMATTVEDTLEDALNHLDSAIGLWHEAREEERINAKSEADLLVSREGTVTDKRCVDQGYEQGNEGKCSEAIVNAALGFGS